MRSVLKNKIENSSSFTLRVVFFNYKIILERSMERDKFMSAQEALEFGLIDKILTNPTADMEKVKKK